MSDENILAQLSQELAELEVSKETLLSLIDTAEFESSHYDNQNDIYRQYEAMCNYSDCLERRIQRAEGASNDRVG